MSNEVANRRVISYQDGTCDDEKVMEALDQFLIGEIVPNEELDMYYASEYFFVKEVGWSLEIKDD